MKNFLFICLAFIGITSILSCQKEDKKVIPRFLDVNIKFSGVTKPNIGDALVLNLHYEDVTGRPYDELAVGASQSIILDQQQIEKGFRVTFEDFVKEDLIYLSAYIDVDHDGQLGTGDFALFYPDIAFGKVELGETAPDNITKNYAVSLDINVVIGGAAGGVVDIDGNVYETVVIGGLEWMKENLKVTRYRDGAELPTGLSNSEWAATTSGAYAIYPHGNIAGMGSDEEVAATFGLLYNWYAVDNPKGLCPEGWRVATDNDWKDLETTIGMTNADVDGTAWRGDKAGLLMGSTWWTQSDIVTGTDDFGFTALPVGARYPDGSYNRFGTYAYFWSSTPSGTQGTNGIRRLLTYNMLTINRSNRPSAEGQCIRCVKGE